MALADDVVRVPIHGAAESLNLATAAAVCLYASGARPAPRRSTAVTRAGAPYDLLPDGVVVADPDGPRRAGATRAATRLTGISAQSAVGRPLGEVLPLVDARGRDWWACTQPYDGLATRVRQPETELTLPGVGAFLVTAAIVRDGGPRRPVDRGGRRAARDRRPAARAERDRAELVATVAHELRSPLTSVKGFTATLLAKWDRFTDEQRRLMLETVDADADRVTRLITELLDVARIDSGRLELHRSLVDLPALRAAARRPAGRGRRAARPVRGPRSRPGCPRPGPTPTSSSRWSPTCSRTRSGTARAGCTVDRRACRRRRPPSSSRTRAPASRRRRPPGSSPGSGAAGGAAAPGSGLYIVKGLVEAHGGTVRPGPRARGRRAVPGDRPAR